MSDFTLSSLKREQFIRDLFWLKNHSVECQTSAYSSGERARNVARRTAAATACPISQVSKDARLRHRSFHL